MPPWKAKIPFDSLRPRYEFPEAVTSSKTRRGKMTRKSANEPPGMMRITSDWALRSHCYPTIRKMMRMKRCQMISTSKGAGTVPSVSALTLPRKATLFALHDLISLYWK